MAILLSALLLVAVGQLGALCCVAAWLTWALAARGAASHDEMMDDVASALAWVRDHQDRLVAPGATQPARVKLFGGYSSGGHVAVSLLQQPELLEAKGLALPAAGYDGVLLLSGVLGARSGAPLPACTPARDALLRLH